jgi:hypothetical protein
MYCQSAKRKRSKNRVFSCERSFDSRAPRRKIILKPVLLKGLRMLNNIVNCILLCEVQTVCSVCNREQVVKFPIALSTIKAVPLQAWSGPEGSRKLRFPDFMTTAQDGGKVVSLTHRQPLPPGNTLGTHFC